MYNELKESYPSANAGYATPPQLKGGEMAREVRDMFHMRGLTTQQSVEILREVKSIMAEQIVKQMEMGKMEMERLQQELQIIRDL